MEKYIAHISEDGRVQTVLEHLEGTAKLSAEFGAAFGAADAARTAGLYHDIGKYSERFQNYICGKKDRVDHSTAGAQLMIENRALDLAFAIAGHHGGIPDGGNHQDSADEPTLLGRRKRGTEDCSAWKDELSAVEHVPTELWTGKHRVFNQAFYTRMLYSCLVDADFLDTEQFMNGEKPPRGEYEPLSELYSRAMNKAKAWLNALPTSEIGVIRNEILRSCIESGRTSKQGLFTLTVPTGGGKTFASLAFAMEHAMQHHMDRIIFVVPYTSIIDQTVNEYRKILGEENVLAHYSEADYRMKGDDEITPQDYRQMLAAENWDAPVIVTTAVQFFDSLYSNRSSRCRKLHNIANSVVIFDEAQTLPTEHLRPCLAAIGQLVERYHTSAVLCTATQPELGDMFTEFAPEQSIKEICVTDTDLYTALKRTTITSKGEMDTDGLADLMAQKNQVLCVVNHRATAQEVYGKLPQEGRYCLTTLLTPSDRRKALSEIRQRLKENLPCRVVSTSLIEAGVDVDFPMALREETGLDSVIQTAGRCNREGSRDASQSMVYTFSLKGKQPPLPLRLNRSAFRNIINKYPDSLDSREATAMYFKKLWALRGDEELDRKGILSAFEDGIDGKQLPFRQVAEMFHLIDDSGFTVYIPLGEGADLCEALRFGKVSRSLYRKLGSYVVSVYNDAYRRLFEAGAIEKVDERSGILLDLNLYSSETGLRTDAESGQAFFI